MQEKYGWSQGIEDYGWLNDVADALSKVDQVDGDITWITEIGKLNFAKFVNYVEDHKSEATAPEAQRWFRAHDSIIDWENDFEHWKNEVKDEPGYEWLHDVFNTWMFIDGVKADQMQADGKMKWDYIANYFE